MIEAVVAVAHHPDAADQHAVLVEREAARIGGEAERRALGPDERAGAAGRRSGVSRSEQGSWLNCTPNSGPLSSPAVVGAGGKCSCTIMLAVRVEKALPPLER